MKETQLLYRIDGKQPHIIMDKCPLTIEEANKINNIKEREMWTFLAGVNDEDMRAFRLNRTKATKKLKQQLESKTKNV